MSQPKRKSKDDSESGAPEAKIRGAPKADLVKLKLQNTTKFDTKLLESSKYDHNDAVTPMRPEDFTMDYYHKDGLKKVLVFDCDPKELNMKVPPSTFTPRDVMNLVGKNRSVKYFNVPTQTEFTTSFEDFVDYFETPADIRMYSYNVISLEVSGTGMMDLVQAPALVRQVDLASAWPDERKQREISFDVSEDQPTIFNYVNKYPRVEHFCLMSASASYTGFHIDFHGSSVWYHVVNGEKVFFIIEPTEENIRKYEEYLKRKNDFEFFGDLVDKCTRVTVKPGQTLMLPSGWIHSVYTPMDTLVFGGNFIHPLSLKMQMRIVRHENELELKKHEKYPQADEVVFHYMDDVVRRVTGRRHIRPSSINRQKEGLQYVGDKFIEMMRHRDIPDANDFKENRQERWRLASIAIIPEAWQDVEENEEYKEMTEIFSQFDEMKVDVDTDKFFIDEHPHIFYHPKEFNVESRLKGGNPCAVPLPLRFRMYDVKKDVNDANLRQCIHPSEIIEWEALIEELLTKRTVNLPEGLTRPNSLVHSFHALLSIVRRRESRKPRTDVTKYYVPPRVCRLEERWNQKMSFDIQRRRHASVAPSGAKRAIDKSRAKSTAPGPAKRGRIDQENTEPATGSYASRLNSLRTLVDTVVSTTVGSVLSAAAAESIEMDPSIRAALATLQQTCASIIAAPAPAPAAPAHHSQPTPPTPSTVVAVTHSASSSPAVTAPRPVPSSQPMGIHRQPYTEEENGIIIRICREWMLGYDDRRAKREEAIDAKVYASKTAEAMAIDRAKQRKPRLHAVENVNNLFKALPNRSETSIRAQIQRLKNEPSLKAIVEQFETGTLTSITAPAPAPLIETPSTPSIPADDPAAEVSPLPTPHTPECNESLDGATTPDSTLTDEEIATSSISEADAPTPASSTVGIIGRPWSDQETEVIIRLCREWLLGYDDRMAKQAEENAAKVYPSEKAERAARARSNAPKARRSHLQSTENVGNILKELADRTEMSIRTRLHKLSTRSALRTMIEQFENGTLTAESIRTPAAVAIGPPLPTPLTPCSILSTTPISSLTTISAVTVPSTLAEPPSTPSIPLPSEDASILTSNDADSETVSSSTPTPAAALIPTENPVAATSSRITLFGQLWTDHENDVIIQQCRKWLLGYDDRMAKIAETKAGRVYSSKQAELVGRVRVNSSKQRDPCLSSAENIGHILRELPDRSYVSIEHKIRKLKSQSALKTILEQFENGTLSTAFVPTPTTMTPEQPQPTPLIPTPINISIPSTPGILPTASILSSPDTVVNLITDQMIPATTNTCSTVERLGRPWTKQENKVVIRLCREWMLGYDHRIAKKAEAKADNLNNQKHQSETRARSRASTVKPRRPCFCNSENLSNIQKELPDRSGDSIHHQIRKLKREPILKAMIKQFEKGTLN